MPRDRFPVGHRSGIEGEVQDGQLNSQESGQEVRTGRLLETHTAEASHGPPRSPASSVCVHNPPSPPRNPPAHPSKPQTPARHPSIPPAPICSDSMLSHASRVPRPGRPLGTTREPLTSRQQAPRCHYGRPRGPHHGPRGSPSPPPTAAGPRVNPDLLLPGHQPREGREPLTNGSPMGPAHQEEAVTGQREAGNAQREKEVRLTPGRLGSHVTGGPCRALTDPRSEGSRSPCSSSCPSVAGGHRSGLCPSEGPPAGIGGAPQRPLACSSAPASVWRLRHVSSPTIPARKHAGRLERSLATATLSTGPRTSPAPGRLPRQQAESGRRGATSPATASP